MSLPPLPSADLPLAMFTQACFDLPDDTRLALARQLHEGKLTLREAIAKGYSDAENVDDWVDFWHEHDLPCQLRELLDLSSAQYAEWMRNPETLKGCYPLPKPATLVPAPDAAPKVFGLDEYIPMSYWSRDHWTTLSYIETVMVDFAGFQVGADARMKSNRRNFRVMSQECPKPKRASNGSAQAMVMDPSYATKLNDGQQVPNHDDWACVQDMAAEGLFVQLPDDVQPGTILRFSEKGHKVANAFREFRRDGGKSGDFRWPDGSEVVRSPATVAS